MKNHDKIFLLCLVFSLAFAIFCNIPILSAQEVGLAGITLSLPSETHFNDETFVSNSSPPISFEYNPKENISVSYYQGKTVTGIDISSAFLFNDGSDEKTISLNVYGNSFNITIIPGQSYGFSIIKGMVIATSSSGMKIDNVKTTYYEMNKWLRIVIDGDCNGNSIFVFTPSVPTRISSSVSVEWSYYPDGMLLKISPKSCSEQEIVIDWEKYPVSELVFVEDMTRMEELSYNISSAYSRIDKINAEIESLQKRKKLAEDKQANLSAQINSTISEKNSIAMEIIDKQSKIANATAEKGNLERTLSAAIVLSPLQSVIMASIFIALALYISLFGLDRFYLSSSKKEDEKKKQKKESEKGDKE